MSEETPTQSALGSAGSEPLKAPPGEGGPSKPKCHGAEGGELGTQMRCGRGTVHWHHHRGVLPNPGAEAWPASSQSAPRGGPEQVSKGSRASRMS